MGMQPIWRTKQKRFSLLGIAIYSHVKKSYSVLQIGGIPMDVQGVYKRDWVAWWHSHINHRVTKQMQYFLLLSEWMSPKLTGHKRYVCVLSSPLMQSIWCCSCKISGTGSTGDPGVLPWDGWETCERKRSCWRCSCSAGSHLRYNRDKDQVDLNSKRGELMVSWATYKKLVRLCRLGGAREWGSGCLVDWNNQRGGSVELHLHKKLWSVARLGCKDWSLSYGN